MQNWYEGDDAASVDASFKDYSITATPNDFNVKTICDFIESGVVKIPGFQRNYVWDIERASKLIESLLIGLPIPQLFLYEKRKNEFLVIDGQQRLMSIYYFFKKRFPRKEKRQEIRKIFAEHGTIPAHILEDERYFVRFNLQLPSASKEHPTRFHGKNYDTLGEHQVSFNLATIRNIIIKQTSPDEENESSIFEIFNRLNTGGVNLSPHEIRYSLYYSNFLHMFDTITYNSKWLHFTGKKVPDINLKDAEVLFRAFAMLNEGEAYRETMGDFLNRYARKTQGLGEEKIKYAKQLIETFFNTYGSYPRQIFSVTERVRFNISYFEAAFRVICEESFRSGTISIPKVPIEKFELLRSNQDFVAATRFATGQSSKVQDRYNIAKSYLLET